MQCTTDYLSDCWRFLAFCSNGLHNVLKRDELNIVTGTVPKTLHAFAASTHFMSTASFGLFSSGLLTPISKSFVVLTFSLQQPSQTGRGMPDSASRLRRANLDPSKARSVTRLKCRSELGADVKQHGWDAYGRG